MKKIIILIISYVSISSYSQNIPDDFLKNSSGVTTRGNYIHNYSLVSEGSYTIDENGEITEVYKANFEYYTNTCISTLNNKIETYEFSNNKLINHKYNRINSEHIFLYGVNDKPSSIQFKQPNYNNIFDISYNENKIISTKFINEENVVFQNTEFTYNDWGNIAGFILYKNDVKYITTDYVYDNQQNLIKETYKSFDYNESLSSEQIKNYEYNDLNLISKLIIFENNTYYRRDYIYDSFNSLKTEQFYRLDDEEWVLTGKSEYIYNDLIDLDGINLPPSEVYITSPYITYEINPIYYKQVIIPNYEKGIFKRFVEKISFFSIENEEWIETRFFEYKLNDYNTLSYNEFLKDTPSLVFKLNKGRIESSNSSVLFKVYNVMGKHLENNKLEHNIYIISILMNKKYYTKKIKL
ncbi:hypothetical protein Q4595_14745 [Wenyingzhuangia sp. 1_MG-2023]|nr:hypothetical protein [Wenyingzhuangia sp. 1_MG-2023]